MKVIYVITAVAV